MAQPCRPKVLAVAHLNRDSVGLEVDRLACMSKSDRSRAPLRRVARAAAGAQRRVRGALGRSPDFIIVGAAKSGTTALFNHLCGHSRVSCPERREIHYFDVNYARGSLWYRSHFPLRYPIGPSGVITGESTPYYMLRPDVPARVAAELPSVRLIALLRNPVDRAYSHWAMLKRKGIERLSFEDALAREEKMLPEETRRVLSDPTHDPSFHRLFSYRTRGLYLDQLLVWHAHVPRENMSVVISERLFSDPASVLPEITRFLRLPPPDGATFAAANTGGYRNKMASDTRDWLSRYYREPNKRLAEYLGTDLEWDD